MIITNQVFYIIILLLLIVLFLQFFISNNNTKERIKILLEKQSIIEQSISDLIIRNFDKIDSKFDKSSFENHNNLSQIREKMSLIDRAQQNISSLTENVVDLKNFLSNTTQRGRFGEMLLENLIKDHLPKDHYEFQKTLSNSSRVDCMIMSPGSLNKTCIDAKFPKESFEKFQKSVSKDEKLKLLKKFKSDIKNHISTVQEKTKVTFMGPSTFSAYCSAILLGFNQIEGDQKAKMFVKHLEALTNSIDQLNEATSKHENNLKKAYTDAQAVTSSAEKMKTKMQRVKE